MRAFGFRHQHDSFLSPPKFRLFSSDLYESKSLLRDDIDDDDPNYLGYERKHRREDLEEEDGELRR